MQILSRTPTSAIRERGVYGQTVLDLQQQLSRILVRRSGQENYGALFAEPGPNRAQGDIVWRTRLSGTIKAWAELSEAEQAEARRQIDEAAAAVLAIAKEYRASEDKARSADADAFFAALGYDPASGTCQIDYSKSFTVDGVPVLTEWGCDREDGVRHPVALSSLTTGQVAAPVVAATAALPEPAAAPLSPAVPAPTSWPAWWRWIWMLLLLTLLLAVFAFLVRGCAPVGLSPQLPTLGGLLPPTTTSVPQVALDQERALRREIEALGQQLDERALACVRPPEPLVVTPPVLAPEPPPAPLPPPPPPPPPAPPPVPPPAANEEAERLSREGAQVGQVNVSLRWNNYNDLDLIVIDPNGHRIYFDNRRSPSGGVLDVDMNARGGRSREPIENIGWASNPPRGRYQVRVMLYEIHEAAAIAGTDFTVTVTVFDKKTNYTGRIRPEQVGREIPVATFNVP